MPLLDGEQSNVILGYLVNKTTNDSTPNYEEESLEGIWPSIINGLHA